MPGQNVRIPSPSPPGHRARPLSSASVPTTLFQCFVPAMSLMMMVLAEFLRPNHHVGDSREAFLGGGGCRSRSVSPAGTFKTSRSPPLHAPHPQPKESFRSLFSLSLSRSFRLIRRNAVFVPVFPGEKCPRVRGNREKGRGDTGGGETAEEVIKVSRSVTGLCIAAKLRIPVIAATEGYVPARRRVAL